MRTLTFCTVDWFSAALKYGGLVLSRLEVVRCLRPFVLLNIQFQNICEPFSRRLQVALEMQPSFQSSIKHVFVEGSECSLNKILASRQALELLYSWHFFLVTRRPLPVKKTFRQVPGFSEKVRKVPVFECVIHSADFYKNFLASRQALELFYSLHYFFRSHDHICGPYGQDVDLSTLP